MTDAYLAPGCSSRDIGADPAARPATGLLLDETAEQRAARHAWYDALAAGRLVVEERERRQKWPT